jgi:uncharacterized protein (TIGR03437 family)
VLVIASTRKEVVKVYPLLYHLAAFVHPTVMLRKIVATVLFPAALMAHIEGPDARHTAAPGDDPLGCATGGCHTGNRTGGPINAAGGSVTATFSSGSTYTPGGSPITITVAVTDPSNPRFGFQMTARLESDLSNGAAGDFTAGANQIVVCADNNLKPSGGCGTSVQFIEHSFSAGASAQSTPYTFTWTPPATNVGNVRFYVAGNAVNNNHVNDAGDHVYTANFTLTPASSQSAPSIVTGGVLNAASFAKDSSGLGSPVAPGSLVAIFASNFGDTESDASVVPLPTALGNVSVTVGGISAPLLNVIPAAGLINAQVPFDVASGPSVDVVLTVNGTASTPQAVTIVPSAPGIFSIPPGAGNAVLVNLTDGKIAAPESAGASIGLATRPIHPGEQGFFYATGLGALTPSIATGANDAVELHTANNTPIVWIGGVNTGVTAQVLFAGQAPQFPGVNQINIVIPQNAPTGNAVPIQVQTADGRVISPANATIAVQ